MLWTVVRFPDGSWSFGDKPDSPDYVGCEVWQIEAPDGKRAVKAGRDKRSRELRAKKAGTESKNTLKAGKP